jgi:hypothetical protein
VLIQWAVIFLGISRARAHIDGRASRCSNGFYNAAQCGENSSKSVRRRGVGKPLNDHIGGRGTVLERSGYPYQEVPLLPNQVGIGPGVRELVLERIALLAPACSSPPFVAMRPRVAHVRHGRRSVVAEKAGACGRERLIQRLRAVRLRRPMAQGSRRSIRFARLEPERIALASHRACSFASFHRDAPAR